MKRLSKLLLTISITGFVVGLFVTFSGVRLHWLWTIALPTGAVFFGLFMIAFMLQNEMARFDEEERRKRELAERHARSASVGVGAHIGKPHDSDLTTAHSH